MSYRWRVGRQADEGRTGGSACRLAIGIADERAGVLDLILFVYFDKIIGIFRVTIFLTQVLLAPEL